jgi:hypothetical protein
VYGTRQDEGVPLAGLTPFLFHRRRVKEPLDEECLARGKTKASEKEEGRSLF